MEMKLLEKNKEHVKFLVKGTNSAFVNSLRRIIIFGVPTMAIEDVTIKANSSALYDEALAHRLGLIPLKTDLKSYTLPRECKCKGEGCEHCQLHLKLKAKGPKTVYSGELKSQDPKVIPVFDKMPIVKLLENQEININAIAILGEGKTHIKFSPGLVYYQGYPKFKLGTGKAEQCAKACPKKILQANGNKIKVIDEEKCDLCQACQEQDEKCIQVKGSKEDFIITIEPFGQLTPEQIIRRSIEIFNKKLKELDKAINKIK